MNAEAFTTCQTLASGISLDRSCGPCGSPRSTTEGRSPGTDRRSPRRSADPAGLWTVESRVGSLGHGDASSPARDGVPRPLPRCSCITIGLLAVLIRRLLLIEGWRSIVGTSRGLALAAIVVLVDQISKHWMSSALRWTHGRAVPGFSIQAGVQHRSRLQQLTGSTLLLGLLSLTVAVVVMVWVEQRRLTLWQGLAVAFLLGTIGSGLDRWRLGTSSTSPLFRLTFRFSTRPTSPSTWP